MLCVILRNLDLCPNLYFMFSKFNSSRPLLLQIESFAKSFQQRALFINDISKSPNCIIDSQQFRDFNKSILYKYLPTSFLYLVYSPSNFSSRYDSSFNINLCRLNPENVPINSNPTSPKVAMVPKNIISKAR